MNVVREGFRSPLHVCFAVLVELEVRGFTEDEELSSVDVSVRRGVAEVLDVGEQFVGKVISSHLMRHLVLGEWWRAGLIERGDVTVMNNGKAHFSGVEWETIVEFFEDVGVTMIRLPVYSPELSPIELVWNQIKARLSDGGSALLLSSSTCSRPRSSLSPMRTSRTPRPVSSASWHSCFCATRVSENISFDSSTLLISACRALLLVARLLGLCCWSLQVATRGLVLRQRRLQLLLGRGELFLQLRVLGLAAGCSRCSGSQLLHRVLRDLARARRLLNCARDARPSVIQFVRVGAGALAGRRTGGAKNRCARGGWRARPRRGPSGPRAGERGAQKQSGLKLAMARSP